MSVMANGWGSREKARLALKKMRHTYKDEDDDPMVLSAVVQSDEEILDAKHLADSSETMQSAGSKPSIARFYVFLDLICIYHIIPYNKIY